MASGQSAALNATAQAESRRLFALYACPGYLAIRSGNWNSAPFTEVHRKRESSGSRVLAENPSISGKIAFRRVASGCDRMLQLEKLALLCVIRR